MTITVPKTRIMTGPGVLLRAPVGNLLPGQTSYTATNMAVASGVATITIGTHGMLVGEKAIVSVGNASLDGLVTLTAVAATTISYATTSADISTTSATGTAITWKCAMTVSGSKFTDSWPTGWVAVGATKDGSEFKWSPKVAGVEVAEYTLPLRYVPEGVESSVAFAVAEFTAKNMAWALNGGENTTVSGTGATTLTEIDPPELGSEVRTMIGWQSDDATLRRVYVQCFQGGSVSISAKKGGDAAAIGVEFSLEQPAFGKPFREFHAGSTAVGL